MKDFQNLNAESDQKLANDAQVGIVNQANMFNSIEMCLAGLAAPKLESPAVSHIPKLPISPTQTLMQNEQSTINMSVETDEQDSMDGPPSR